MDWDRDTYLERLALLLAGCLLCAAYLYAIHNRLRPGLHRLAVALPVLGFNCLAPALFRPVASNSDDRSEIVTIVLVEFALTWLSNFKALAWAANRGPLAARRWSFASFAAIQLAPITPREGTTKAPGGRQSEHGGGSASLIAAFAAKAAVMVAGLAVLRLQPPQLVVELLYTIGLYAILSFTMDGPAAAASALIGMEVAPHFDAPWLSTSIAEAWARRWNLAAGNTLRQIVYDPILEGRLVRTATPRPPAAKPAVQYRQRRRLASALCFLVSGAMHEVQFWYMTGRHSGSLMLAFFLLQPPLLEGERLLGGALRRRGVRVPAMLRTFATLATLLLLAHWTFWLACNRYGVTAASLVSVKGSVEAGRQLAAALLPSTFVK